MKVIRSIALSALVITGICHDAHAQQTITGRASVIDADTIEVHGERIRLEGIDAPESAQRCMRNHKPWRCGQAAALALDEWLASRPVACKITGKDRYGRHLARCSVNGLDMQAWLVSHGYALAYRRYSTDYVTDENRAREARAGVWSSEFTPPWEWRKHKRENQ